MSEHQHDPPVGPAGQVGADPLERALWELAERVEFPSTPELSAAVRDRLVPGPADRQAPRRVSGRPGWVWPARLRPRVAFGWPRPVVALVVAVLVAVLVLSALPGPRAAVADLLGLGGVEIRTGRPAPAPPAGPTPRDPAARPGPGLGAALGERVTLAQARAAVAFPVRLPGGLGAPTEVWVDDRVPGGMLSLAWSPRPGLPDTTQTGTGALLTVFRGTLDDPLLRKALLVEGTRVEEVPVGGAPGRWVHGALHELYVLDTGGDERAVPGRLAGNTLLWVRDGLTYRLEADVDRDTAVRIATSLR